MISNTFDECWIHFSDFILNFFRMNEIYSFQVDRFIEKNWKNSFSQDRHTCKFFFYFLWFASYFTFQSIRNASFDKWNIESKPKVLNRQRKSKYAFIQKLIITETEYPNFVFFTIGLQFHFLSFLGGGHLSPGVFREWKQLIILSFE